MNTSKSLNELVPCDISCGINGDPADGFGDCTCGRQAIRAAIVEAVEGIYGDSDGLREFAGLPSNQVVNPSPKQT